MGHAVLEFLTEKQNVQIHEYVPRGQLKAFYVDKHIFMDTDLTEQERSCILAEEWAIILQRIKIALTKTMVPICSVSGKGVFGVMK